MVIADTPKEEGRTMPTFGHEGGYAFNEDQRGGHTDPPQRATPTIPRPTGPYTVERIPKELHAEYRIADRDDNRVGTCYVEENARLIVDALNGSAELAADRDRLLAAIKPLLQAVVDEFDCGGGRELVKRYQAEVNAARAAVAGR